MTAVQALTQELTDAGVAGVTISWADNNGIPRSRTVPVAALPEVAVTGVGITSLFAVFDSSDAITFAHPGLATPSGDVRLIPELGRLVRLAGQRALAWAPGRQVDADGGPWPYDQGSLARLRPGYFAGAFAFWGVENREAPLRYVPGSALLGADHANVELKASDASANPYLALAALLAAGAAGVAEGLTLDPPVQSDPGTWSESERAERGIAALPGTQAEQEAALTANPRLPAVLGKDLLGAFLAVRRADAAAAADRDLDDVLAGLRWRY